MLSIASCRPFLALCCLYYVLFECQAGSGEADDGHNNMIADRIEVSMDVHINGGNYSVIKNWIAK